MGQTFKHVAIRLWASFFLGSLSTLVVLPLLAGVVGPALMIGPALILFAASYWLIGIVFASLGRRRLDRLIGEASVWERAGMAREARQALALAEATVDSFYFSPFSRKTHAGQLLAQLARFQLSQSQPDPLSESIVRAYLHHFPDDREAAVKWLEKTLAGGPVTRQTHDIAAHIGTTHTDDMAIQRLLAQFYLLEGCCDFAALRTFRQLVDGPEPLPDGVLADMADLFCSHQRADTLALEVYLKNHHRGRSDPRLMEGIAACCRLVHPTPLTQPLLNTAEAVLADVEPVRRQQMASAFLPEIADTHLSPPRRRKPMPRPSTGPLVRKVRDALRASIEKTLAAVEIIVRYTKRVLLARQTKMTIKWAVMGLFCIGVGWLVVSTGLHLADDFKPVETAPAPVVAPVMDPFTLQVAAYLKADDATRFVNQLKQQGLDAYWTRASGNSKTWYQVRISHFKTKADARSMGEALKNRHLIEDYYVANYKRPDVQ